MSKTCRFCGDVVKGEGQVCSLCGLTAKLYDTYKSLENFRNESHSAGLRLTFFDEGAIDRRFKMFESFGEKVVRDFLLHGKISQKEKT